jgi:hypothetical protein
MKNQKYKLYDIVYNISKSERSKILGHIEFIEYGLNEDTIGVHWYIEGADGISYYSGKQAQAMRDNYIKLVQEVKDENV